MTLTKKLKTLLTKRDKKILIVIVAATIFISVLEVANISLLMLFISAITNFKIIHQHKYLSYVTPYTGPLSNSKIILFLGLFLILFFAFRCFTTFIYHYKMQNFVENRRHIFTFRFFQNYLQFNYKKFASKNPATISKLIFNDATQLTAIISSSLTMLAELFTVLLIYGSLIFINWKMTLVLTCILTTKVFFLLKTFSKKLSQQGAKAAKHSHNIGKIYNESFRNFKLIKILSHEDYILSRFKKEDKSLIKANVLNKVLQETPRLFLETIGFMILVGAVIYVVYRIATPEYIIPILSMYALAFYRFMPSTTKIMNAYNSITFAKGRLDLSNDLMYKTEQIGNKNIEFKNSISLKNISFSYNSNNKILSNVSLKINKKERIAFIGESGTGKSTLADIIMGFYLPKNGAMFIDNQKITNENLQSWRNKIGYIPQNIYLFDGTVAENIVFGRSYNKNKIISVLKKANIYNYLLTQDGIYTKVGEGGIRLSGGQMQRIAIARALYSNPELLVLDEATSALDNKTETNIMNEIYNLDQSKTLIIIAHRLSTILKCEKIYRIENQQLYLVNKTELYKTQLTQTTKNKSNFKQKEL